jgi:phosphoribosylanthranilate isomerase
MTWVKICGTTNLEDALVAVEAGADAVGFVFYEKSPRWVDVETAREIVDQLPASVEKVGVFVEGSEVDWGIEFLGVGLTAAQFYLPVESEDQPSPRRTNAIASSLFPPLPKVFMALPATFFMEDGEQVARLVANFAQQQHKETRQSNAMEGSFDTYFLDSGGLRQPGGTGRTFDWVGAKPAVEGMRKGGLKVAVAGGLTPENVGEAIGILRPWGVDVVSGVEARPGKKDPEKVRAFVRAVREFDRKVG